jgi:hypothetical protein
MGRADPEALSRSNQDDRTLATSQRVANREPGLEHGHLLDLVALLLDAREPEPELRRPSGGKDLALELESRDYGWVEEASGMQQPVCLPVPQPGNDVCEGKAIHG